MMERMDDLTPQQIRAVREGRGWTPDEMANAVAASPMEVRAWEAGTIRPPETQEAWIRWLVASDEWSARVVGAELPQCGWLQSNGDLHERMFTEPFGDWSVGSASVRYHIYSCDACLARWDFARRMPRLPQPPDDNFDKLGPRYLRWVKRRPGWMQMPLRVLVYVPWVALLFSSIALVPDPDSGWPATAYGLSFGALFALAAHRITREGLARLRARHPYTAGVLTGAAVVTAGLLGWNMYDSALHITDARVLAAAGLSAVALGLISGFQERRDRALDVPRPAALPGTRIPAPDAGLQRRDAGIVRR